MKGAPPNESDERASFFHRAGMELPQSFGTAKLGFEQPKYEL